MCVFCVSAILRVHLGPLAICSNTHSLVVFSLRQQPPDPVPVAQTGGGVEWDRWAASTNLFTFTAWLMRPVGAQLQPASGM